MAPWHVWLIELAAIVLIALILRFFVGMLIYVRGSSMRETLSDGDLVIALRYTRKRRPQRFDVVICRYPNRKEHFIKRIIGMPGERIRMEEDTVFINDVSLQENFLKRTCKRTMKERIIGAGEYFVLGDNRPNSRDSRSVGTLSENMLIAHSVFVIKRIEGRSLLKARMDRRMKGKRSRK